MRYPKAVKPYFEALLKYTENNDLKFFNILHMYPGKIAYPKGFFDSKFFELVGYNKNTKEFKRLGTHDELVFGCDDISPTMIRIFLDGSTLIKFHDSIIIDTTCQSAYIWTE